jgi:outer membrane protein OmpA-like peptidoglycan-associated protein
MMDALTVATQDLLSELRINPEELRIMAKGYSPDYPGASKKRSNCRVQLSHVTAKKLYDALILDHDKIL